MTSPEREPIPFAEKIGKGIGVVLMVMVGAVLVLCVGAVLFRIAMTVLGWLFS